MAEDPREIENRNKLEKEARRARAQEERRARELKRLKQAKKMAGKTGKMVSREGARVATMPTHAIDKPLAAPTLGGSTVAGKTIRAGAKKAGARIGKEGAELPVEGAILLQRGRLAMAKARTKQARGRLEQSIEQKEGKDIIPVDWFLMLPVKASIKFLFIVLGPFLFILLISSVLLFSVLLALISMGFLPAVSGVVNFVL